MFFALKNYGVYIVDDSAWDDIDWNFERGAALEYRERTGTDFGDRNTPVRRDLDRMVAALSVVTNNGPGSVGGGGSPLQPPAPALS